MKFIIILLLLTAVLGFLYWRLRPYIRMARQFLGVAREMNRMSSRMSGTFGGEMPRHGERPGSVPEKLARCAVCGTWIPDARAVRLRSTNTTYCSHQCLERAAEAPARIRRSAS